MEEGVSSDSSFYICFADDIKRIDWLFKIIDIYSFYLGEKIWKELPEYLTDNKEFSSKVKRLNSVVDYYELLKPYFGRDPKHLDDGEYEAIGIAYYLHEKGCLKYLILDDRRVRRFVEKHFSIFKDKLTGTIGFIRDCCCKDRKLSPEHVIEILLLIKESVESNNDKRPCSIDKTKGYEKILIPTIEKIKRGCKDE